VKLTKDVKALFKDLMNPLGDDLFELAKAPELGEELVLTHIAIMRAYNETIPASLIALERILVNKGHKLIDPEYLRRSGLLGDQKA
jgi:hypothetical protein